MSNNADASLLRPVRRAVPSLSWAAIERATGEVFQDPQFAPTWAQAASGPAPATADADRGAFENSIIESHQENWTWAS